MVHATQYPEDAQVSVTLSAVAYLAPGKTPDQQRAAMTQILEDPELPTAGKWRVVWGPVTVEENLSFIARGPALESGSGYQYAHAIRGTDIYAWNLIEDSLDGLGLHDLPWGGFPGAQISDGGLLGWRNLTRAEDNGQTALGFLQGIEAGSELMVTGHSMGGYLAEAMAFYWHSALSSRIKVSRNTFAATTVGNQALADTSAATFGGAGRYYNDIDVVAKIFNHDDLASIKDLYPGWTRKCGDFVAGRAIVDLAMDTAGHRYFQPPGGTALQAKLYREGADSFRHFLAEVLQQHHVLHYMWLLGIPLAAIQRFPGTPFVPPTVEPPGP